MENNFNETPVTPEAEVTQPAQGGSFTDKLDLEGKSKALMAGGTKVVNKLKSFPKKVWAMIGAGVAALVLAIVLICIFTNTYKTPVSIMQKQANAKSYTTPFDQLKAQLNGYASSEIKTIIKIMKKSEDYKDELADAKENYKESIEEMKEEYGSNYKYTYKITDKEKIDKDDLKEYRDDIRDRAESYYDGIKEFIDDADSDDWEDLADEMGISKAQAKELAKTLLKIAKKMKSIKISAGYELDVTVKLDGKEMDEPNETDMSMVVVKVDGRWVSLNALSSLLYFAGNLS